MPLNSKDFHFYFAVHRAGYTPYFKQFKNTDILVSLAGFKRDDPKGRFLEQIKAHKGRVMLDSGGFTNQATPGFVKYEEWRDFVKDNLSWITEYVQFDVIGDRAKTLNYYDKARKDGLKPIPVDHLTLGSQMERVRGIYRSQDKVCLGGFGIPMAGTDGRKRWEGLGTAAVPRAFEWLREEKTMCHLLAPSSVKKFLPYLDHVHSCDSAAWGKGSAYGQTRIFEWGKIGDIRVPLLRAYDFPGARNPNRKMPMPPGSLQQNWHAVIRRTGWEGRPPSSQSRAVAIEHIKTYVTALKKFDPRQLRTWMQEEGKLQEVARKYFDLAKAGRETGDVHPGTAGEQDVIELGNVLKFTDKPMLIRSPAVTLVGSICTQGQTKNDVDVLIHGPLDEMTRRVIEFRVGRTLPPEVSKRVEFHNDEMGGPFTDHVHLYDLVLVPRDSKADGARDVMRMSAEKRDDPALDYPKTRGKKKSVLQVHTRGRTAHFDLRLQVADFLVGWTLFAQKAGVVPDVETVSEARALYAGFSAQDGNKYFKPVLAPSRLQVTGKLRQPKEWLDVEGQVMGEGEVGATSQEKGVIVAVARPDAQWGLQLPHFHEYFLTGDKQWRGRLLFRLLLGGKPDPSEESSRTEEGQVFWTGMLSKGALPTVLTVRAVEQRHMPPLGHSAMPETLEDVTPPALRFWEAKTEEEAKEKRAELVASRHFTDQTVALVDGEFRRVVTKRYLDLGKSSEVEVLEALTETRKVSPLAGRNIVLMKTQEERYVLGIVLEPNDGKNGSPLDPDSQKDIYSKAEVRQAAFRFMEEFRNVGLMHQSLVNGKVKILESFVVPDGTGGFTITDPDGDKQTVHEGTWLLGLRVVDDVLWQKVKSGELGGLSIGGSARRVSAKP